MLVFCISAFLSIFGIDSGQYPRELMQTASKQERNALNQCYNLYPDSKEYWRHARAEFKSQPLLQETFPSVLHVIYRNIWDEKTL